MLLRSYFGCKTHFHTERTAFYTSGKGIKKNGIPHLGITHVVLGRFFGLFCFVGFFFFAMEWIYYHFLYVKTLFTSMHNVFLYKILQILEQKKYIYIFSYFNVKAKAC